MYPHQGGPKERLSNTIDYIPASIFYLKAPPPHPTSTQKIYRELGCVQPSQTISLLFSSSSPLIHFLACSLFQNKNHHQRLFLFYTLFFPNSIIDFDLQLDALLLPSPPGLKIKGPQPLFHIASSKRSMFVQTDVGMEKNKNDARVVYLLVGCAVIAAS